MARLHWIVEPSEPSFATVVFIHGIDGHALRTWTPLGQQEPWIGWLAARFPGIGLATIAYGASVSRLRGEGLSLAEYSRMIAPELREAMAHCKGHFLFVCHSLGGLIFKQIVVMAGSHAEGEEFLPGFPQRIGGVVFYATPHDGSRFGTLSDRLRMIAWPTSTIQYLATGNDAISDLSIHYRNIVDRTKIRHLVLYETRATLLGFVVTRSAANPGLPGLAPIPIPASTHSTICKPTNPGHPAFRRLEQFITAETGVVPVTGATAAPSIDWPDIAEAPRVPWWEWTSRLAVTLLLVVALFRGAWVLISQDVPDLIVVLTELGTTPAEAVEVAEALANTAVENPRSRDALLTALQSNHVAIQPAMPTEQLTETLRSELERADRTLGIVNRTKISSDEEVQSFRKRAIDDLKRGDISGAERAALSAALRDRLVTESGARVDGSRVIIDQGWVRENIKAVELPLGRVWFLDEAAPQLLNAFDQVRGEGLLERIEWCGSYSNRPIARTQIVSAHALGIAFDINCSRLKFGNRFDLGADSDFARIVEILGAHGFAWGGDFAVPDPMHFELYEVHQK